VELDTQYRPAEVEGPLYERWVAEGLFSPDRASADAPAFTVVIPPPNVNGSLHLGHALEHTLIDAVTRRKRMQGFATLWLPGTDHASIAVETLVERLLAAEGTSKAAVGREAFLQRAWAFRAQHGGRILDQMRRLGDGVDWSRLTFTMDPGPARAVHVIFKELFDAGLIYRAERLVNWSPVLQTAISDIEVEHSEVEGELVTLDYGTYDGVVVHVATTRAETMLGDTAVAVHPEDERYARLVGTHITLPITGRAVPVVADAHVDPAFGTGVVKVTPAHDPNDFAIGQRHGLPAITVLDEHARITGTGTRYDGMDRYDARRELVDDLRAQGLVVAERRPYLHSVGHSSRSGEAVEPRLSLQWYVAVEGLACSAGDAVRAGRTRFSPPEMAQRFFGWVDDMHDWCISRQLWWGLRLPIYYGPGGEVVCPAPGEEPTGEGWVQDPDVLDTWFSSAIWPFSTLGWPEDTADLRRHYPTSVLVTGYDIIFFWVARMMMMGTFLAERLPGPVPFDTVAIHGLVRDAHGKKMSKSRGNVVDPLEWVDRYGADALRFALARGANPGTDFPLAEESAVGARNFCNKVWNAVRFALLAGATPPSPTAPLPPPEVLTTADRWVLSRLTRVQLEVDPLYDAYELAKLSDLLYGFAWNEVFDWYLEIAKVQLLGGAERAAATRLVLGHVMRVLLELLHPLVPFLTEVLWTALTGEPTVVIAPWPSVVTEPDAAAEAEVTSLVEVVTAVRRLRAQQGLAPRRALPAVVFSRAPLDRPLLASLAALDLEAAPRAEVQALLDAAGADTALEGWAVVTGGGHTVALDLSGTVDTAAQRAGWERDLAVAQTELARQRGRLAGPAAAKAPDTVVADWRRREGEAAGDVSRLEQLLGAGA